MSFGFGVGDFLTVARLARTVYMRCRDSPSQYRRIAEEASRPSHTLQDLEDLMQETEFDPDMRQKVFDRCKPCQAVLIDLNKLLDDYQGMSIRHKSIKDSIMWDEQETRDIRARMTSTTVSLLALYNNLHSSLLLELRRTVKTLFDEFRAGNLESDSLSAFSVGDYDDTPVDDAWKTIAKDLEMRGFGPDVINGNRQFIVECIIKAANCANEEAAASEIVSPTSLSATSTLAIPAAGVSQEPADLYSGPFIRPQSDNPLFVTNLVRSWNLRNWSSVQTALQNYIGTLNPDTEVGFSRQARHLEAMSHSFEGNFREAKHLLEQNLLPSFRASGVSFDDAYVSGGRWLGEACLQLKEAANTILAWSVSLKHAGVFDFPRQTLIGNSNELLSLLYVFDASPDDAVNINDHDIFTSEDDSAKKSIVMEALRFVQQHRSLILQYANPLKSSSEASIRITEDMLNSTNYWEWRFMITDPFFYASGAARLIQHNRPTEQPKLSRFKLQLLRDGIHTTTVGIERTRHALQNGLKDGTILGKSAVSDSIFIEIKCGQIEELLDTRLKLPIVLSADGVATVTEVLLELAQSRFPSSVTDVKLVTRFEVMSRLFPVRAGADLKPAMPDSEVHVRFAAGCTRIFKQFVQKLSY